MVGLGLAGLVFAATFHFSVVSAVRRERRRGSPSSCEPESGEHIEGKGTIYTSLGLIGVGSYGRIIMAEDTIREKKFAIKVMNTSAVRRGLYAAFPKGMDKREVESMKMAALNKNSGVIGLESVFYLGPCVFMVMEWFDGSNIFNVEMDEVEAKYAFWQLAVTMKKVHDNGIVHLDISDDNVLYNPKRMKVKVIDFGVARGINEPIQGRVGTGAYIPPEASKKIKIKGNETYIPYQGAPKDVWSMGILLHGMLTKKKPTVAKDKVSLHAVDLSTGANALIERMLTVSPNNRITSSEILDDPWMQNVKKPNRTTVDKSCTLLGKMGHAVSKLCS